MGFAIIKPEPVITEEITKDPTSPIALAAQIREKNRGSGPPWVVRLMLPVVAAAVLVVADLRRRSAVACVAYGIVMLALFGWSIGQTPAFSPLAPSVGETIVAVTITVVAGLLGSVAGRWIADALQPAPASEGWRARGCSGS